MNNESHWATALSVILLMLVSAFLGCAVLILSTPG